MIDIKDLLDRPDVYRHSVTAKNGDAAIVDTVINLYEAKKKAGQTFEELRAEQNRLSKEVPMAEAERKQELLTQSKEISIRLKSLEQDAQDTEKAFLSALYSIPNLIDSSVIVGKDDGANSVLRKEGTMPAMSFKPKEHWELGERLDLIDTERAGKVSGSRFFYLKNDLVFLEQALMSFVMKKIASKGFVPMIPPYLVRERAMFGTGYFPDAENGVYLVNPGEDDLYLIGTSEVSLVNYHDNEVLDVSTKPLRYVGISPCFRREAGSYGKDTKGILRVHQFEKVEMVSFTTPDKSAEEHEFIRSIEEEILQDLEIPYQVLNICSGDLGGSASKKYDLEAWMPGQEKYREVTSTSNTTDFQSRRLNIRFKNPEGKLEFVHILNGTGASMRPLIAIMENYQDADGSIRIPKLLQGYMQKEKISV